MKARTATAMPTAVSGLRSLWRSVLRNMSFSNSNYLTAARLSFTPARPCRAAGSSSSARSTTTSTRCPGWSRRWRTDMTLHRGAMFATSFYAGLGTMAFEMVLGRALVPYFGGTIYTWGALIAVFLLGMSFGFFLGGRLADRYPRIALVSAVLAACGAVILCTPLYAEPLCLRLLDGIEDVRLGALVASLAMAFLPALLFAAVSPVVVRLALVDVAHSGSTVGAMSGLNTVGSIVGTIGTSFFLVPVIGSRALFYLLRALTIGWGGALFAPRGRI